MDVTSAHGEGRDGGFTGISYRLVPHLFDVCVQFSCQYCNRPITIKLDDLEGPFTCRAMREKHGNAAIWAPDLDEELTAGSVQDSGLVKVILLSEADLLISGGEGGEVKASRVK